MGMLMYILKAILLLQLIMVLSSKNIYAQTIKAQNLVIYDYEQVLSFYKSQISSETYAKIVNYPKHAFSLDNKICAFYSSGDSSLIPAFFYCSDTNLSKSYINSATIFKQDIKPLTQETHDNTVKEHFGENAQYQGIINVFTLGNRLFAFHKIIIDGNVGEKVTYKVHTIIYDESLDRTKEKTIDIFSHVKHQLTDSQNPITRVLHIEIFKVTDSTFAIVTYIAKISKLLDEKFKVITAVDVQYYDDNLTLINQTKFSLPFEDTYYHESIIDYFQRVAFVNRLLLEPENERIKLYSVTNITKGAIEKNEFLLKTIKKQNKVKVGNKALIIFDMDLRTGDVIPAVIDLGNLNRTTVSALMKKSEDEPEVYYFISTWRQKNSTSNKLGISIVKFTLEGEQHRIIESAELGYLPHVQDKSEEKQNSVTLFVTDIRETSSKYIISALQKFIHFYKIIDARTGTVESYEFQDQFEDVEVIVVDKKSKQADGYVVFKGNIGTFKPPFRGYNINWHNIQSRVRFIDQDSDMLLMFPYSHKLNFSKKLHPFVKGIQYERTYYSDIIIEEDGSVSVSPAKPFVFSEGNMSGFALKNSVVINGRWYVFYSIDGFIPAVAVLGRYRED